MTTTRYKDIFVMMLTAFIALLVIDRCNHDKIHYAEVTTLDNKIAIIEVERLLILDSVDVLNETIQAERMALTNRLNGYKLKPIKERIKLITRIDSFALPTDTGAILSLYGVDSVNVLAMAYESCIMQSAVKDTITNHLRHVIAADSLIIVSQQKSMKEHKKAAKTNLIRAAVSSGLIGIIIGLLL
jgi:hypothetical protein